MKSWRLRKQKSFGKHCFTLIAFLYRYYTLQNVTIIRFATEYRPVWEAISTAELSLSTTTKQINETTFFSPSTPPRQQPTPRGTSLRYTKWLCEVKEGIETIELNIKRITCLKVTLYNVTSFVQMREGNFLFCLFLFTQVQKEYFIRP